MSDVMKDVKQRIDQLVEALLHHGENYYINHNPTIGDHEYNKLYRELEILEENYPSLIRIDSPTHWVAPRDPQAAMKHVVRMLSLTNLYTEKDLRKWVAQFPPGTILYADLKHDGMSIELVYICGILTHAITRGDGEIGIDVTPLILRIPTIPKKIPPYQNINIVSVTGELTIPRDALIKVNARLRQNNHKGLPNCRNAVASIMKTLEPEQFCLDAIEFNVYGSDVILKTCRAMSSFTHHLRDDLGFKIRDHFVFNVDDLTPLFEFYAYWNASYNEDDEFNAHHHDHPIDGIVIKVDDSFLWEGIGYTKKAPKFAMAWKFDEIIKTVTITRIHHAVGKLGTITPAALFDPVQIDGTRVSHVNLVNTDFIHRHGYYVGAIVEVYKAGGVIPRFRDTINLEHVTPYEELTNCPRCARPLEKSGASLRCSNLDCDGVVVARLIFACSRECLNIKGYGPIGISSLVEEENIRSLAAFLQFNYTTIEDMDKMNFEEGGLIFSDKDPLETKRTRMVKTAMGLCIPSLTEKNLRKLLNGTTDEVLLRQWGELSITLREPVSLSDAGISTTAIKHILEHAIARTDEIDELVAL